MTALSPLRVGRITGSRIPMLVGVSPYGDRESLMREMVRQRLGAESEFTGNIATEHGLRHEPDAIAEYEKYRGVLTHSGQHIVVHRVVDYLAVTPDGLVGDDGLVEVKCPYMGTYTSIEERPDYWEQIQLQLEVTDREWCDFAVWRRDGFSVQRVGRDPGWLITRGDMLDLFIAEYEDIIYDTDKHAPYLADLPSGLRDDFEWQLAAVEFVEAHGALSRAEKAKEAARRRLVELAGGDAARGAGVMVLQSVRSGSIDYRAAAADLLVGRDLEPYRKESAPVTTVRVAK